MSLLTWPFKRKQYAGIDNPRFVSDIVAANEAVIDAMIALTGLGATDFAILSGMTFTAGFPNGTYTAGVFYLNGNFYIMPAGFSEGVYLAANPIDSMPQAFEDAVSRNIYTLLQGIISLTAPGNSPQFTGNMNNYRLGAQQLKTAILSLQAITGALGTAAFENVGILPGEVMAADDARFLAIFGHVLLFGNTTPYTPGLPYEPATKQYADQAAGFKIGWLGNISFDGATVTKLTGPLNITVAHLGTGHYKITHNIGNVKYYIAGLGINTSFGPQGPRAYQAITNNDFEMVTSDDASLNDTNFQLQIYQYF